MPAEPQGGAGDRAQVVQVAQVAEVAESVELRYEDGPSTEAEVLIEAPAERVWALVSDIELPARFSTEFRGADWLDDATGPALGARFVGRSHHERRGEWETTCVIVEFEPHRRFGYVVGDPDLPSARWRFTLAAEDGGTRLTQWMQMGPGRSGISPVIDAMPDKESKILHRRLGEHRANMEATVGGIKALSES